MGKLTRPTGECRNIFFKQNASHLAVAFFKWLLDPDLQFKVIKWITGCAIYVSVFIPAAPTWSIGHL
jgi:hypothetical protein